MGEIQRAISTVMPSSISHGGGKEIIFQVNNIPISCTINKKYNFYVTEKQILMKNRKMTARLD